MLDQITPLILTLDEAPNIARTLDRLAWAKDIVVVDSYSQDETCSIVHRYPNVRLFHRKFDRHSEQWNFGLTQTGIATEWVLALDADFVLSAEVVQEIESLSPAPGVAGYAASFSYCIDGRPLRNTVYPPVTVLYRGRNARYEQDGHTQRVRIDGYVSSLAHKIAHDDRKPFRHWLRSQGRYMRLESQKLGNTRFADLSMQDKVRRFVVIAPAAMLFYCLFAKGNILDGRAGLIYAFQRTLAESILSAHLVRSMLAHQRSTT